MAKETARLGIVGHLCATALLGVVLVGASPARAAEVSKVIETYADIAHAKYEDALNGAVALEKAVDALIAAPTDANLKAARAAWIASRPAYQETEGVRFGNPIVDDWEGRSGPLQIGRAHV